MILHQPSERDLSGSGNAAYMRLEPVLACVRVTNQETHLEGFVRSLEEEINNCVPNMVRFIYLSQIINNTI
jgi:hypothetical protein